MANIRRSSPLRKRLITIKVMLEPGAIAPTRAHGKDAGLDLYSRDTVMIPAHGSFLFDTGVHVELPEGKCGVLISKSGLNCLYDLTSEGLIDEPFRGSIKVKLYNHGDSDRWIYAGDKISQMVIQDVYYETVEIVDALDMNTERGENGLGSTGR